MCYTEAHCRVAALLRSHSGEADGNFDETSALTKFAVLLPPGIAHSVALRGEAGLDFIFGGKIRAML